MGKITVELQGRINDCRALTYRQDLKAKDIEKYTANKLPTRQVCVDSFYFHCIEIVCYLSMKIMFYFCLQNRTALNLMFEQPCPSRGTVSGFETLGSGSNLFDT